MDKQEETYRNRVIGTGIEDLDQILFNPENWRTHPKQQQEALKKTFKSVGIVQPVLVNQTTGRLVDGHLRCQLAAREGQKQIPVTYLDLTEEEERIILASLDPIGEMASTDKQKLNELLNQIRSQDDAILALLKEISDKRHLEYSRKETEDPGDLSTMADELKKKWKTEAGQIWTLGRHRIMCGDSTNKIEVMKLFDGAEADAIITDPPYGVSYDTLYHITGLHHKGIEGDDLREKALEQMLHDFLTHARLKQYNTIYIFFAEQTLLHLLTAARTAGIYHSQTLVWVKDQLVPNRQDYNYKHEPIFYGWRGTHKFYGSPANISIFDDEQSEEETTKKIMALSKQALQEILIESMVTLSSVQREARPKKSEMHPTMKPVRLVQKLIQHGSPRYGTIYDPFLGSGTDIIAAEETERRCIGMEKDPKYFACCLERYQIVTGEQPKQAQ